MIYLLCLRFVFHTLPENVGIFSFFFFSTDESQYLDQCWQIKNILKLIHSSDLHICLQLYCICCRRRDLKVAILSVMSGS